MPNFAFHNFEQLLKHMENTGKTHGEHRENTGSTQGTHREHTGKTQGAHRKNTWISQGVGNEHKASKHEKKLFFSVIALY